MLKLFPLAGVILLTGFFNPPVFADMVSFDFDEIHSQSKKGPNASAIELYMEGLFGEDISLSHNAAIGKTRAGAYALGISNGYLTTGKGRGSGIALDFGDNPIHSFSVDWLLRKGGKSFTILADGVVVTQQALSKAQKKSGISGHLDSYFFDSPVHRLEFIGSKKKSFGIDNLVINIPTDEENEELDNSNEQNEGGPNENNNPSGDYLPIGLLDTPTGGDNLTQLTAAVPEPSSLLMLMLGLCGAWASRKIVGRRSA